MNPRTGSEGIASRDAIDKLACPCCTDVATENRTGTLSCGASYGVLPHGLSLDRRRLAACAT